MTFETYSTTDRKAGGEAMLRAVTDACAAFDYYMEHQNNGDRAKVHLDKDHQVLVVEGLDSNKYDGIGYPLEKGVYHMWDIRFYADEINKNAIHRAELFNR